MPLAYGTIVIWSGSIASIPAGWLLCDGNNGTPDLRDKFLVGAGGSFAVNDSGGASTHNHIFSGSGHTHTLPVSFALQSGANFAAVTSSTAVSGLTATKNHLPPYHSLAYIMKD